MMNAWNLEYLHINITSTFTQNFFVVMWLHLWQKKPEVRSH